MVCKNLTFKYTKHMTYQELISKIQTKERFDFSRWGDGEWLCLLQKKPGGKNCDAHYYFPDLGEALMNVLKDSPDYYIGLQALAKRQFKTDIDRITEAHGLKWTRSDIIHRENIKHGLESFFEACKNRDVLLVGGNHLYDLCKKQGWYFVEIPRVNCWQKYDETKNNINALIDHKEWVILYCASMMSNVLIHAFKGRVTQVDVGSAFDPYVNVQSRKYHYNL